MAKLANRPSGGEARFEGDQALETHLVCDACDAAVNDAGIVAYDFADPVFGSVDFAVFHVECDSRVDHAMYPRSITLESFVAQLARRHLSRSLLEEIAGEALDPS